MRSSALDFLHRGRLVERDADCAVGVVAQIDVARERRSSSCAWLRGPPLTLSVSKMAPR
jgi:hypothetical protein